MKWTVALFLFAAPFWETKAPADWTEEELRQMLTDSPWAQMVSAPDRSVPSPPVQIYLATAAPIEQAELEIARRYRRKRPETAPPDQLAEEYRLWLADNRPTHVVLAVRIESNRGFFDEQEMRHMEEESIMRAGRKKIKMTGHFPPSATDPYLRLAFPRPASTTEKSISFELYLPGVPSPFREAEFKLKDMAVKGKLEI